MRIKPNNVFHLTIKLPWFELTTETMCYHFERRQWIYYRIFIRWFKWKINFLIGRKD